MASLSSTVKGSQNINQSTLNIGYCKNHARENEAFCEECRVLVCPSCVMFGSHQGHKVIDPKDAINSIKERIDKLNKSGKLNKKYSERFLLDIRDTKIKLNACRKQCLDSIQESFKKLLKILKSRKESLEDQIYNHYYRENEEIDLEEKAWIEKLELGKTLLEFSNDSKDEPLLTNSLMIMSSIDLLNENSQLKSYNHLNNLDLSVNFNSKVLGFTELLQTIEKLGEFGEYKQIQFRI